MKKTLLLLIAFLMTIYSFANSITINNNSNATLYYSLRGEKVPGDPTTTFGSTEFEIIPGQTLYFNHPSAVPGLNNLPSTSVFSFIKGYTNDCPGVDITVGCSGNVYSITDFINNVCPPTISFIVMSGVCNVDDLIVNVF